MRKPGLRARRPTPWRWTWACTGPKRSRGLGLDRGSGAEIPLRVFTALSLAAPRGVFAGALAWSGRPARTGRRGGGAGSGRGGGDRRRDVRCAGFERPRRRAPAAPRGHLSSWTARRLRPSDSRARRMCAGGPRVGRSSGGRTASRGGARRASRLRPLYGAVGDRAAGDLVTTFKRVFPIAVSSDSLWDHVPVGFYAKERSRSSSPRTAPDAHDRKRFRRPGVIGRHHAERDPPQAPHLYGARRDDARAHGRARDRSPREHGAFTIDAAGSFELPSGRRVSVSIVER